MGALWKNYLGLKVKRDIYNNKGLLLIPAGTRLDNEHTEYLEKHEVFLDIDDFISEPIIDNEVKTKRSVKKNKERDSAITIANQITHEMMEIFDNVRQGGELPIDIIKESLLPNIVDCVEKSSIYELLFSIQSKDDYTYRHNLGVAILSLMLGKWLYLPKDELTILTTGALLHDIGKTQIPVEILNKPGKLTDEEFAIIKKHPEYGYNILKQCKQLPPRCAIIALQHHEREDGRGYPLGLMKHKIDYLSKIVSVADVYHAMTSKRSYHDAMPFYLVLKEMQDERLGALDPIIVRIFLHRMMEHMVGKEVLLTSEEVGTIIHIHPSDPFLPLVKLGENNYIDLSKNRNVKIKQLFTSIA